MTRRPSIPVELRRLVPRWNWGRVFLMGSICVIAGRQHRSPHLGCPEVGGVAEEVEQARNESRALLGENHGILY
jgi:hypothetical protein